MTSTPERPGGQPTEEPPDRSTWTVPIGHTEYAPLSGSSGYPPPESQPVPPEPRHRPPDPPVDPMHSRPPGELAAYPPPDEPERETRATARSHRADPDVDAAPRSRGVLRHLLGLFTGLVLTPCAITLLAYGGYRYSQIDPDGGLSHDTRGLVTLGAGAFVLLLVACSGALSPLGPFVGALWGLGPAGLYLVASDTALDLIADVPVVPDEAQSGAVSWLALGCYLAVGVTLLGTFVATAARPRR